MDNKTELSVSTEVLEKMAELAACEVSGVKGVAEAVQQSVKDKIQTMTGTAVTRVNVNIEDIDFAEEAEN